MTEPDTWKLLSSSVFEVEGKNILGALREEFSAEPTDPEQKKRLKGQWDLFLKQFRIRIGTLLKTDHVSFLLGAGASKDAGGVLLGSVPIQIEKDLRTQGVNAGTLLPWLRLFYLSVHRVSKSPEQVPITPESILARNLDLEETKPLAANFEETLSLLYRWRTALPQAGGKLTLDGTPQIEAESTYLDECIKRAKLALASRCVLPTSANAESASHTYREFLRRVLTRPLNLRRLNIFTLN